MGLTPATMERYQPDWRYTVAYNREEFTRPCQLHANLSCPRAAIDTAQGLALKGQQTTPPAAPVTTPRQAVRPRMGTGNADKYFKYFEGRSKVSPPMIKGDSRRKNIYDALLAIDDQIRPRSQGKKYVFVKLNGVEAAGRCSVPPNPDALGGILDYLAPAQRSRVRRRFRGYSGPAAASKSAGTRSRRLQVLNPKFEITNENQNPLRAPVRHRLRLACHPHPARRSLRRPDAFFISAAVLKTHNMVVATMASRTWSGAPWLRPSGIIITRRARTQVSRGLRRAIHMFPPPKELPPYWGVGVVDGYEAWRATAPCRALGGHRIALASTDFLAWIAWAWRAWNRCQLARLSSTTAYQAGLVIRSEQNRRGRRQDSPTCE